MCLWHKHKQAGESPWYVSHLVSEGAAINARDNNGQTPLHIAAANENPTIATTLIIAGADVNAKDKDGLTPLHIAAANENTKIAKDLVSDGAYVNARDKDGRTPLDVALDNERAFTVKYLLSKRALAHIEGQEKIQELVKKANKGPEKNNASTPLDVTAITVKNLPKKLSEFTLHDILISMQVERIMDGISETHDKSSGEPSANQTPVTNAANVDNGQKRNEKRQVYDLTSYRSLAGLRDRILEEIESVHPEMVRRAFADFPRRLRVCIDRNGASVETR
ncbi:ankyrin repeat domain-containing protein [Ditylenchus destructor]|uniref:Ankyrin repeat domain-containing protein n=1 Tax=Ditylenchus destructor TaxID=166010 RepID=A0AAD4MGI4_9BILA|nr:ankyrin repeat domain-containing protein [Ditylenchus destructor]